MDPRLALGLAIGSAALAVGIVAADLELGLEAELQTLDDGSWMTVSKTDLHRLPYPEYGCANPEMRVVVDNDRIVSSTVRVHVSYWDANGLGNQVLYNEEWSLSRGEERVQEFVVPDEAFNTTAQDGFKPHVQVEVRVGDTFLSSCVAVDQ